MSEEINKYIHEQIMGEHWHEAEPWDGTSQYCKTCHKEIGFQGSSVGKRNPDYCSSASPRALLEEVVAKVVTESGNVEYERQLAQATDTEIYHNVSQAYCLEIPKDSVPMFNATAEQIATACVEAHQQSTTVANPQAASPTESGT